MIVSGIYHLGIEVTWFEAIELQRIDQLFDYGDFHRYGEFYISGVKNIISSENALRGQGVSGGLPIPYIVVQSEIYVSKIGLISWLEELRGKEGCIDLRYLRSKALKLT